MKKKNEKLINEYYVETVYNVVPINKNNEIRILTSKDLRNNSLLVDIRKFSLYGNNFDDIKKPTTKGIKFKLRNVSRIMVGLLLVMLDNNIINYEDYHTIKNILLKYV